MISYSLANVPMRETQKLHYPQNHGYGGFSGSYHGERLPPIADLLRSFPLPPVQSKSYPMMPPSPLPSPVAPSFVSPAASHPNWSSIPPRPRSVPGQPPNFMLPPSCTGPRRASAGCVGTHVNMNSQPYLAPIHYSGPVQIRYERPGQDRERGRQRRNSKHQARLRRTIPSEGTDDTHAQHYYPVDHAMITTPPASPVRESIPVFMETPTRVPAPTLTNSPFKTPPPRITTASATTTHIHSPPPSPSSHHQHLTPQSPTSTPTSTTSKHNQTQAPSPPKTQLNPLKDPKEKETRKQKQKRNNKPYTFEQEAFVVYHRIDLDLPWEQVRQAYMARWPDIARSVGGLECAYYRANGRVPDVVFSGNRNPGGELVLVEGGEREEDVVGDEVKGGSGSSDGEDEKGREEGEDEGEGKEVYKVYKGVAYRTRGVKCRKARISLLERFPEELVDERNEWVRAEHRVAARDAAERRRRQREEWLAARLMRE